MSKPLWNTIKIDVPKEMLNITKKGNVVTRSTLTKSNNISKSNNEPAIIIKSKDIEKPMIENPGKTYNVKDLKERVKKSNEIRKKNEGKEYKKKSENIPLKSYVKKINDKIVEKKNKPKPEPKPESKLENKSKSDIDEVVDMWDKKDLPSVFKINDLDTYNKIETIVTREIKRKNFIMPFDLLVFTKIYNNKVVEVYSKNKNYKEGLDILYKGIYTMIYYIMDHNNIKKENAKILDVFKDIRDYNLAFKRINSRYASKIRNMQLAEIDKKEKETFVPITSNTDIGDQIKETAQNDKSNLNKIKSKRKKNHPFINYD